MKVALRLTLLATAPAHLFLGLPAVFQLGVQNQDPDWKTSWRWLTTMHGAQVGLLVLWMLGISLALVLWQLEGTSDSE